MKSLRETCDKFFKANNLPDCSSEIIQYTELFLNVVPTPEKFKRKTVMRIVPLYIPGDPEPAYYEVWFTRDGKTPKGWVTVGITDQEVPVSSYSPDGKPHTQDMIQKIDGHDSYKIVRYSPGYYATEDSQGSLLVEYGTMPRTIPKIGKHIVQFVGGESGEQIVDTGVSSRTPREDIHFTRVTDYTELRKNMPRALAYLQHRSAIKQIRAGFTSTTITKSMTEGLITSTIIDGTRTYHAQIPTNSGWNPRQYGASGCNNNAWLNIYCWWSLNKGKRDIIPRLCAGTCPVNRETQRARDIVDPIQIWLGLRCGTDPWGNTEFWDAYQGMYWIDFRGYTRQDSHDHSWPEPGNGEIHAILEDYLWKEHPLPVHVGYGKHFAVGIGMNKLHIAEPLRSLYAMVRVYPGFALNDSGDEYMWWGHINSVCGVTF